MSALVPLHFQDHVVRFRYHDGQRWLCARDVCACWGIESRQAVAKSVSRLSSSQRCQLPVDTLGGSQEMTFVTLGGAIKMGLQSNKPQAEPFVDWVSDDVMVPVLTAGRFEVDPMSDDDIVGKALTIVADRLVIAESVISEQEDTIEAMVPAYDLSEARTQGKFCESTTSAWKAAMGRRKLTEAMRDTMKSDLWKESRRGWEWRQRYLDSEWGCNMENEYAGIVKDEVRWYEKGRLAIPHWVAEQDRQVRTHGDVAPLPRRLGGDRQRRLPGEILDLARPRLIEGKVER